MDPPLVLPISADFDWPTESCQKPVSACNVTAEKTLMMRAAEAAAACWRGRYNGAWPQHSPASSRCKWLCRVSCMKQLSLASPHYHTPGRLETRFCAKDMMHTKTKWLRSANFGQRFRFSLLLATVFAVGDRDGDVVSARNA
jgi:hypothetical protein